MKAPALEIGQRLRAYRLGAGLSAEDVAGRLNLSRAAVYRFERFGITRLDTLQRVAKLLDVSVASLMGVDVEYTASAVTYFERLRQIEETADWMFVVFGPVSYLLTSDDYDHALERGLAAQFQAGEPDVAQRHAPLADLMRILVERKKTYRRRRPAITNVIPAADLTRFARSGFSDDPNDRTEMHLVQRELRQIAVLAAHPPIGVQIGIVFDNLPTTSFTIARQRDVSSVLTSPFRVGAQPNVRNGVAMITASSDAVTLHSEVAQRLWGAAMTGEAAAQFILDEAAKIERLDRHRR